MKKLQIFAVFFKKVVAYSKEMGYIITRYRKSEREKCWILKKIKIFKKSVDIVFGL